MNAIISASKVMQFSGHRDSVYALSKGFTPDTFFSAGADNFIVSWTLNQPDGILWAKASAPVYALHTGNAQLLAGTRSGLIHIIDAESRQEIKAIQAHDHAIFDIKSIVLNGQPVLVTAAADGTIKFWDSRYQLMKTIALSSNSIRSIDWHESTQTLAAGSSDQAVYLIDLTDLRIRSLQGHTSSVFAVCFADSSLLITGGRDAVLKFWEPTAYTEVSTVNAHWYHINHIVFNPSGRYFATCSLDKTIKLWDALTFELIKVIDRDKNESHTSSVNKLLWMSDHILISCSDDRQIMQFSIN